ncbi:N,N'-diacetylchitobiose transport system permease protein [Streptomyces sp. DvalAA-14]|uniref:carbohydrate ABC transporter permease n=1 Tax=unclassified Streptomyces TaxID=2593676 RepID=UPI00081AF378|nr:carbohydrate ABC transporter permease [Streptomyces sp. DvalAA-14]MYS20891.1 ABC transporter permease subunit [Streptomyces sp. SID4948]SCD79380.1 N,N'-diacetylchitobiose transport system permease protein [Streptomyces sp. DvalAA-14]
MTTPTPVRQFRQLRRLRRLPLNLAALLTLAVTAFPVYWMLITALKPSADIQSDNPSFLPLHPTLAHFRSAVHADGFGTFWRNSLTVTLGAVLMSLAVALLASFAVARMRWPGRRAFILLVFTAQMAPWEALLIPVYVIARDADMLDKLSTLTLIYFMTTLPFTIVTLRGFLAAIPVELEEAAQVDGCTRPQAFRRITFPLLAPGLLSTSLFGFITAWNEFAFANTLIITRQDARTLPVWLSSFSNVFGTDWGATMAASTLFMLPVLLVFLLLQNRVTSGMTAGAVKG